MPPDVLFLKNSERRDKISSPCRETFLFPHRNNVDDINDRLLNALPGQAVEYPAVDSVGLSDNEIRELVDCADQGTTQSVAMEHSSLPALLRLKLNAPVMLLRNISTSIGLANGKIGVVEAFVSFPIPDHGSVLLPRVRFDKIPGTSAIRVAQYSSTQASDPNMPSSELFEQPQSNFDPIKTAKFISIVLAPILDTATTPTLLQAPNDILPDPESIPSRLQLPLRLAYSYSIHKSQGQSLSKYTVDFSRLFEYGQAYVALSRGKQMASIRIRGYDKNRASFWKLLRNPRVVSFYESMHGSKTHLL